MIKAILKGVGVPASALFFGIFGWLAGAYIGGNFAESFTFNGVRGYEATGQFGFIAGALLGIYLSAYFLFLRSKGR